MEQAGPESPARKYAPIPEFTKTEMEAAVAEDDVEKLIYVPLFASLYYEDRAFAEDICVRLADHSNFNVRAMAIEGFEHIARIDGELNEEIVKPVIEKARIDEDEFVRGRAEETIEAIERHLKWKFNK